MSVSRRLGLHSASSKPAPADGMKTYPNPASQSSASSSHILNSPKASPGVRVQVQSPAPSAGQSAPQSYSALPALDKLHRYVITGTLQQSLFGVVKLAFDRLLKIQVAIKISRRERAAIQQTRSGVSVLENVRREASICSYLNDRSASGVVLGSSVQSMNLACKKSSRAVAAADEAQEAQEESTLPHRAKSDDALDLEGEKYLCRFIEELEDEYFHYLINEFVPAGDLYSMLTSFPHHRLNEQQARVLFRQIVLGVRYLHTRNVAHLDISLENICLDQYENCRIIDFGVAALHPLTSTEYSTNYFAYPPSAQFRTGSPDAAHMSDGEGERKKFPCEPVTQLCNKPGKIRYMSPELFSGSPWDAFANDIFSLGVILYSLLTGRPPFQQADNADVWFSVIYSGQWLTPAIKKQPSAHVYTHLSSLALDLINNLLKPEAQRFDMAAVLRHPWMTGRDE